MHVAKVMKIYARIRELCSLWKSSLKWSINYYFQSSKNYFWFDLKESMHGQAMPMRQMWVARNFETWQSLPHWHATQIQTLWDIMTTICHCSMPHCPSLPEVTKFFWLHFLLEGETLAANQGLTTSHCNTAYNTKRSLTCLVPAVHSKIFLLIQTLLGHHWL